MLNVGATYSQPAIRNDGGGVEGVMRSFWKTRSKQTQCRRQQEPSLRRVSRPDLGDQYGLILR